MADLQQGLAELKDIHLPEPPHELPIAPGWWLSALALIVASYLVYKLIRHYLIKHRYRRLALKKLNKIALTFAQNQDQYQLLSEINQLLKLTAMHVYPDQHCAALSGDKWQQFLVFTLKKPSKLDTHGFKLLHNLYKQKQQVEPQELQALIKLSQRWIKQHSRSVFKDQYNQRIAGQGKESNNV